MQPVDKPGSVPPIAETIIYLALWLPIRSSGHRPADGPPFYADLLAADRVYLLRLSPDAAVGSYPTRFTFAPT